MSQKFAAAPPLIPISNPLRRPSNVSPGSMRRFRPRHNPASIKIALLMRAAIG
jgi:hypothetical protein